jgi:hypothetical protein
VMRAKLNGRSSWLNPLAVFCRFCFTSCKFTMIADRSGSEGLRNVSPAETSLRGELYCEACLCIDEMAAAHCQRSGNKDISALLYIVCRY